MQHSAQLDADQLLHVGFNSRIAALDRATGALVWSWKAPKGYGYVALLREGNHLFASVNGYTYCLDAATGAEYWRNTLPGFGTGVACLATASGTSAQFSALAQELVRATQRQRSANAPT